MSRTKGSVNKRTTERLEELRSRFALGQTEDEALREMLVPEEGPDGEPLPGPDGKLQLRPLTQRERTRLLSNHYATAGPENNSHFYARATLRWSRRQAEIARVLSIARGIRHPNAGKVRDPETGARWPEFEVAPRAELSLQALRCADQLDRTLLDTGTRLGMLREPPTEISVSVTPYEEMGTQELKGLLRERMSRLFTLMDPLDVRALGIGTTIEVLPEPSEASAKANGKGNGKANGKGQAPVAPGTDVLDAADAGGLQAGHPRAKAKPKANGRNGKGGN